MTVDEFALFLDRFRNDVKEQAPDIIAETAVEYSKEAFSKKAWDKQAWQTATTPKRTGSLLIDSGALANSIRPAVVNEREVIISAGDNKVGYAQVHNEGYRGPVNIPAHTRKGHNVAAHTRTVNIPARPFLGKSNELFDRVKTRLEATIRQILNR